MFEPIAIIGRACLLPGAATPEQLWQNVLAKKDCLTTASKALWRLDPHSLLSTESGIFNDTLPSSKVGIIEGFSSLFDPQGFTVPAETILKLDGLFQWLLHTARQALQDARCPLNKVANIKAGAIVGNLCYPTHTFSQLAETTWLLAQGAASLGENNYQALLQQQPATINRFTSGLPVSLLAQALQLSVNSFALDAACASSLYAVKLACDYLQEGTADMMLAGGINAADSLFLNMGFHALRALSPSGQSRPLHAKADGLVPAHGAGIIVLKRLTDAIAAQDKIYGVIEGIGLSNDGQSQGFLVPSVNGQITAMQRAYETSSITPDDISWIECHATGTTIGDNVELVSMQQVFSNQSLSIGALKANIGHTITASGIAALINVLSAFEAKIKPPTRLATDEASQTLRDSGFEVLSEAQHWESKTTLRHAAINCFGFGGNNAHLIMREWSPAETIKRRKPSSVESSEIAIVGIGVMAGNTRNQTEFCQALFTRQAQHNEYLPNKIGGYLASVELPVQGLRTPPADLRHALGQQLTILKACQDALAEVKVIDAQQTAVFIGMQCDAEIARFGLRWRLTEWLQEGSPDWLTQARDAICPPLQAADVIGTMPNIVTNRINQQFDFKAPSFSISADELSGMVALQQAMHALKKREISTAVVGAVDLCCELVHQNAALQMLNKEQQIPGDAAVVLVLKRLEDAQVQQDTIYAIIADENAGKKNIAWDSIHYVTQLFGHAHAASALLQVAAAALVCQRSQLPVSDPQVEQIARPEQAAEPFALDIEVQSLGQQKMEVKVYHYVG